ncbi:competence type IV pilus major pilin ComGC [Rhodopirellula sp. MGV]|uniref:competence type IV pilus major pilin ComGC n=1 Tax=Rhodopirellula sp. MGV TaxID=2023130 RepID=UPI000B97B9D7|nr:type II secretion system GspH family protein [Rhodopirellula sp. MGV]OYP34431.1 hypothetical protein CGZ80_15400 [Rhodopirellula sp. MGV]PNY37393.1 hypothetical protein C2E31_07620 [Rhodopirellula baltica]
MLRSTSSPSKGISYLELVASVTIIGVLAAAIIPRLGRGKEQANATACELNVRMIELQTVLFYREQGRWPDRYLSEIAADPRYFPDGLPVCPVDGTRYIVAPDTGRVNGHRH